MEKKSKNQSTEHKERQKKESIVDLSRYHEKVIRVKFAGGREVSGILKGYDPLVNLVLDNTTEYLRDPEDLFKLGNNNNRQLGLVVCRGTAVSLVCPMDGTEQIANPFVAQ
ncbi:U6 snRNA-associated Sm-like protein LSm7 [Planococcus citri]|uniref:U6 snRNA-associated Sm-like protein LSm7 n=1 Tax=Planococcus citri TaxID=170843 RepID=UPI0031F9FBD6